MCVCVCVFSRWPQTGSTLNQVVHCTTNPRGQGMGTMLAVHDVFHNDFKKTKNKNKKYEKNTNPLAQTLNKGEKDLIVIQLCFQC